MNFTIDQVVPHQQGMSLLDRVCHWDEQHIVAELVVPDEGLFVGSDGVPAWVGIEYMAQAIAAWAGCRARSAGNAPAIGFLLGTRRFTSSCTHFPCGSVLQVRASCELMADNGLGMFACQILIGDQVCCQANVSVFEPADALAYLESGQA